MAWKCLKDRLSLRFLQVLSRRVDCRRGRLRMQLTLNNRKRFFFCFGLPFVIAYSQSNITGPRSDSSCRVFLQDSFILPFSLKTCLAICHWTACFPTCYILIVFKYGTPHTEVTYAHQASKFRALKVRACIFPEICSKRSNQAVYAWQKKHEQTNTKTCITLGQNILLAYL